MAAAVRQGQTKLVINLKRNPDWVNSSDHVNSDAVFSRRANIVRPRVRNRDLLRDGEKLLSFCASDQRAEYAEVTELVDALDSMKHALNRLSVAFFAVAEMIRSLCG